MTEWLKRIEEWSKRNDAVADSDRYSMGLFVLVLAGLCLQLPLILNVIIQVCFLTCTVHLIYRYFKGGYYILALLKIGIIFVVALADNMFYFKIT
ncbi:MAG: hypothetical protein K2J46_05550 [Muribaculaceae bacterium]|nr:hypothetical protein [Muribaculaceae bacterium]